MDGALLSEFEKTRATKLAYDLKKKIEKYFPEPPNDAHTAEIQEIANQLLKMGFRITWSGTLNPETLQFTADVTLWLPKEKAVAPTPPHE